MAGKNKVYRGDDWIFDFQFTENGDAKDITGATEIKACLKHSDGTSSVDSLLSTLGVTITNAAAGKGTIKFPDTDTPNVKLKEQNLTVILTDSSGNITTVVAEKYLEVLDRDC
jgi:hypothetical protein